MFENWPFTNFHDLNLDWIIKTIKDYTKKVDDLYNQGLYYFVEKVLAAHPEWTTTVQDGAITESKISRLFLRVIKNLYVTPEMFGGAGDGVTDDTQALQDAINDGKPVYISGEYKTTNQIVLRNNLKLFGHGSINLNDTAASSVYGLHTDNVLIVGISFIKEDKTVTNYSLSILSSSNVAIINCKFIECYGYALRLSDSRICRVCNCNFDDITGATGNPGGAIIATNAQELLIEGNTAHNIQDHLVYIVGEDGTGSSGHRILNNYCYRSGYQSLTSGAAVVLYADVDNVIIDNLIIDDCKEAVRMTAYSSFINTPHNISIQNVNVKTCTLDGITMIGTAAHPIKNITINNVNLDTIGQDGVLARYVHRSTISNLAIESAGRYGLNLDACDNNIVTDISLFNNPTGCIIGYSEDCDNNTFSNFNIDHETTGNNGFYLKQGNNNNVMNIKVTNYSSPRITQGSTNLVQYEPFQNQFRSYFDSWGSTETTQTFNILADFDGQLSYLVNPTSSNLPYYVVVTSSGRYIHTNQATMAQRISGTFPVKSGETYTITRAGTESMTFYKTQF